MAKWKRRWDGGSLRCVRCGQSAIPGQSRDDGFICEACARAEEQTDRDGDR